ncbi:thiamine-phosphate synthase [Clostridia bacterium]|nr:thiamine-phosphate synthase [Clostridia bacterium]
MNAFKLYAVTDRAWTAKKPLTEQVEDALRGGVTCLQLREKNLPFEEFLDLANETKKICEKYNVPFIINDNAEVAARCGADGLHIGQGDICVPLARELIGKEKILGVSVLTVPQARLAEESGADYLGVGAVFATSTKSDANAVSFDTLSEICESVSIPVVAIGGITKENTQTLKGSGISGVALVSAIFAAENIERECREILEGLDWLKS